jgi:hypothetical protein
MRFAAGFTRFLNFCGVSRAGCLQLSYPVEAAMTRSHIAHSLHGVRWCLWLRMRLFARCHAGAVTVDWVVLSASILAMALLAFASVQSGTVGLGAGINAALTAETDADPPESDIPLADQPAAPPQESVTPTAEIPDARTPDGVNL